MPAIGKLYEFASFDGKFFELPEVIATHIVPAMDN
jgi:hypothetical protein